VFEQAEHTLTAIVRTSVQLSDIRQDLVEGYQFVHNRLEQELRNVGSQVGVDGNRVNVQGWSAGGTATMFLVRYVFAATLAESLLTTSIDSHTIFKNTTRPHLPLFLCPRLTSLPILCVESIDNITSLGQTWTSSPTGSPRKKGRF
jgi:hypothetical protein